MQCRYDCDSVDVVALRYHLKFCLDVCLTSVSSSFHVTLFEIKGAAVSPVRILVTWFQRDHCTTHRTKHKSNEFPLPKVSPKSIKR